jgi:proteic killer suppression protein
VVTIIPIDPLTICASTVIMPGVIASFGDADTEALFRRERVKRIDPRIQRAALRKLRYLDAADSLDDLRVPPGNRLEALTGRRTGQHSIRVNEQWRIVFNWRNGKAHGVAIVDYH